MQEDFISQITAIIERNIDDEQFGVSELAAAVNMSRSNLLRKIKKGTGLSASQFIRQVRLEIAMDLLKEGEFTVSEISYKVGFGSNSYFIKCFREHYGYPPGEVGKKQLEIKSVSEEIKPGKKSYSLIVISVLTLLGLSVIALAIWTSENNTVGLNEKSIAVLPFKNESNDSSNVYFINGLMESTLNNLQKIEDLRVLSRTSVEKYRNANMSIPEIADELNVKYFVEGSGQKIGDQVLLHIQLIEAATDKHIWSEQYSRKVSDVFNLQNEVATKIADAIEVIVTPEELKQIEKRPTDNLVAYDYYLRSLENINDGSKEGLEESIRLLDMALEEDPEFALAYANIAISYYFLDLYQSEKQYTAEINRYSDKALLYDPESDVSLLAKAFYYMYTGEYRLALPHLEKALEYNPNSSPVIQTLSDYYARIIPNTAKYLEYALMGLQINSSGNDSVSKSYIYLHLSNALAQSGFVEESVGYIDKSLEYNPQNYYSPYLRAYILYARDQNIDQTKSILLQEWHKDTTRLDIMQEVAKIYYYQSNYDSAFYYYELFARAREEQGLDIYPQEDIRIAATYKKAGRLQEADQYLASYTAFCERDQSIYKGASTAVLHAYQKEYDLAIEQLKIFAKQDNIQYWIVLFMEKDPVLEPLLNDPEFQKVMQAIKDRFWENHEKLRSSLEEKGLI